jgi:hypothetical protein
MLVCFSAGVPRALGYALCCAALVATADLITEGKHCNALCAHHCTVRAVLPGGICDRRCCCHCCCCCLSCCVLIPNSTDYGVAPAEAAAAAAAAHGMLWTHVTCGYPPCVYNRCCAGSARQAASHRHTSSSHDNVWVALAQCQSGSARYAADEPRCKQRSVADTNA